MAYCTQCGLEGRPVIASGTDEDREPACSGHSRKGSVTMTATVVQEFCACGREKGHRGRHKGMTPDVRDIAREDESLAEIYKSPKKHRVELSAAPGEVPVLPTSVLRVPVGQGEIVLTVKGDLLTILQNKDDQHFLNALLNVIRCRGQMMHPFSDSIKSKATGNMVPVQMDEGFIDDMLSMADPEEKARMLAVAWEKGK